MSENAAQFHELLKVMEDRVDVVLVLPDARQAGALSDLGEFLPEEVRRLFDLAQLDKAVESDGDMVFDLRAELQELATKA